jgi:hypothetical protein
MHLLAGRTDKFDGHWPGERDRLTKIGFPATDRFAVLPVHLLLCQQGDCRPLKPALIPGWVATDEITSSAPAYPEFRSSVERARPEQASAWFEQIVEVAWEGDDTPSSGGTFASVWTTTTCQNSELGATANDHWKGMTITVKNLHDRGRDQGQHCGVPRGGAGPSPAYGFSRRGRPVAGRSLRDFCHS